MIIQTNIKAMDEHGKEGNIAVKDPKELLEVMQSEGVTECEIKMSSPGDTSAMTRSMTLDGVRKWAEME